MRKGVDDAPRPFMLATLRHELSRWLTSLDEISRVLFPETTPDDGSPCSPAGQVGPADTHIERR